MEQHERRGESSQVWRVTDNFNEEVTLSQNENKSEWGKVQEENMADMFWDRVCSKSMENKEYSTQRGLSVGQYGWNKERKGDTDVWWQLEKQRDETQPDLVGHNENFMQVDCNALMQWITVFQLHLVFFEMCN